MRIYIDTHYFISVINQENQYSCQIMELLHGNGMQSANITEDNLSDVVSAIVDRHFTRTNVLCGSLHEVMEYHLQCLIELQLHNSFSLEDNEKWDRIAEETSIINEMEDEFEDAIDNDINNIAGYLFDQDCGDR